MLRKIDIGTDKNLFVIDPKAAKRPQLKFLEDDIPKNPEEAISEARKHAYPQWINSEPLIIGHTDDQGYAYMFFVSDELRKKVIILDIWDFTLLPCRRSLSYLLEWHKRYGHSGLLIIGIHSPMFEFSKDKKVVMDVVRHLNIPYPVVCDNDFSIWRALENRYWPRRLLMDSSGKFHHDIVGEGHYEEFEVAIQHLLRQISPGLPCPPIMKPLRKVDQDDYQVPTTTPEILLGSKRNMRLGNIGQAFKVDNEEVVFKDTYSSNYTLDTVYLDGGWLATSESIYGTPHKGDVKLNVKFTGTDAYIVARCRSKNRLDVPQTVKVQVQIEHKPLGPDNIGANVITNEVKKTVVLAREPDLYHIVTGLDHGSHELTLIVDEDPMYTVELYGLFFEHKA